MKINFIKDRLEIECAPLTWCNLKCVFCENNDQWLDHDPTVLSRTLDIIKTKGSQYKKIDVGFWGGEVLADALDQTIIDLYDQFIGYSDDGSLDIYLRGSFNFWGFEEDGKTWHKDSKYKMTYYPVSIDYRLTLSAEEASVSSWGQTGEFKFYLNLDDISGGWLGVSDYRRSEVNLPSSYCKEGTDYNFKIPDSL